MYFLVLAALLQLDTLAPKFYSQHDSLEACVIAADEKNKLHDEDLKDKRNNELGLKFVCLHLVGSV